MGLFAVHTVNCDCGLYTKHSILQFTICNHELPTEIKVLLSRIAACWQSEANERICRSGERDVQKLAGESCRRERCTEESVQKTDAARKLFSPY